VSRPPAPTTEEELKALPVLTDTNVFALRDVSPNAIFAWRDETGVWAPVWAHGQWWKQKQHL
jgi:hypothetical protein